MSRIIIFAVLGVASTALAKDNSSCERLNSFTNYTHLLTPREFKLELEHCSDAPEYNLNNDTLALLKVFKAINVGPNCSFDPEMEEKLIECVTSKSGFKKDEFMAQAGKQHFAMNNTVAVQFDPESCQMSLEMSKCVGEKFSEKKVDLELKRCKDKIIHGFHVTEILCREHLIRPDRVLSSGVYELPSKSLIFVSVTMLVKLAIFSQY